MTRWFWNIGLPMEWTLFVSDDDLWCSPVQNCRKFSAVLGQTSPKSSIFIRPAETPVFVIVVIVVIVVNWVKEGEII
jgi:hypothetical protein